MCRRLRCVGSFRECGIPANGRRQMMGLCNSVYLYVTLCKSAGAFATRTTIYTDLHRSTLSYIALAAGERPFARIQHTWDNERWVQAILQGRGYHIEQQHHTNRGVTRYV